MRSKTILFILMLCIFAGVGVRVMISTFSGESMENTNESDGDAEFETSSFEEVNYFKTSELSITGILRESILTGKNVSILIPFFQTGFGVFWSRYPVKNYFYVLHTNESLYKELLLGLSFEPPESLLGSYVEVSGTLTYQRILVTDFFHGDAYVLYADDLEIVSPD